MTSNRPYLLRALYEWIADNGMTPYLLVDAAVEGVQVPAAAIKEGRVVLNIAARAVAQLDLGNREVRFLARFGGVMPEESADDTPTPPGDGPKRGGHLRIVK